MKTSSRLAAVILTADQQKKTAGITTLYHQRQYGLAVENIRHFKDPTSTALKTLVDIYCDNCSASDTALDVLEEKFAHVTDIRTLQSTLAYCNVKACTVPAPTLKRLDEILRQRIRAARRTQQGSSVDIKVPADALEAAKKVGNRASAQEALKLFETMGGIPDEPYFRTALFIEARYPTPKSPLRIRDYATRLYKIIGTDNAVSHCLSSRKGCAPAHFKAYLTALVDVLTVARIPANAWELVFEWGDAKRDREIINLSIHGMRITPSGRNGRVLQRALSRYPLDTRMAVATSGTLRNRVWNSIVIRIPADSNAAQELRWMSVEEPYPKK